MVIGLAGEIGVRKSFVANCFKKFCAVVFDTNFIVYQLYKVNKGIISYTEENFPIVVVNGEIDKKPYYLNIF